jgi:hypothetical protein
MLGAWIVKSLYHLGYRLDDRGIRHQFPGWERSYLHNIQTISEAYPTVDTWGSFPETDHSPASSAESGGTTLQLPHTSSWHDT